MRFEGVSVEAVVAVLPPRIVTSSEIEERLSPVYDRLRLPYGRLELMTGIRERRFWEPGTRPSTAAAAAGQKAIEMSGTEPEAIGVLIHASVCRDFLEPATASVVHHHLGLSRHCAIFDLSNACLGVLNGMTQVATMIQQGSIEAGLVVSGECAESLHEATIQTLLADRSLTRSSFKSHFASLTIGSAAAAVLLRSSKKSSSPHRLIGGDLRTDTDARELCREATECPSEHGPLMTTDSEALLHAGCRLAAETWLATKETLGWKEPDRIFTHQVGDAHRRLLFETLQLDPSKDFPTVSFLGNTGSAALPSAWALGIEKQPPQRGDRIALLGIGSGLSSLMLGVEW